MKKFVALPGALMILCTLSYCSAARKIVAVMPLENVSGYSEEKVAEIMTEQLIVAIHSSGGYTVVERPQMGAVLREQGFQNIAVDPSQAVELGKLSGADYTMVGKVTMALVEANPTAGAVDGTEISSGDETLPLSATLDASQSESKAMKVAVRCDSGYQVEGNTEIYFEGTNAAKWQVAADDNYSDATSAMNLANWNSTLTLGSVSSTNTVLWVKVSSSSGEDPQNDRTVDIMAEGLVVATE